MNIIPQSLYEPLARCLHEYQLSAEQEHDLADDAGFQAWYASGIHITEAMTNTAPPVMEVLNITKERKDSIHA